MSFSDRILTVCEQAKQPPSWATFLTLGYADDGEFYLPNLSRANRCSDEPRFDRRFNPLKLSHWPYMIFMFWTGWVVWLETL